MRKESLEFLKQVLSVASPSGSEARFQEVWCKYVSEFADEIRTDSYGNVIAVLNPKGSPQVMLDGHCDEICMMVKHIDDKGFLYLQPVGGLDMTTLRARRVAIHTEKGPIRGVVGSTPSWLLKKAHNDQELKEPKIHEVWIDIGAADAKEASSRVSVGDAVTFIDEFEMLSDRVFAARACDDKIGVWLAAEALRLASLQKPQCCIYACSSVQEETGCWGGKMLAGSLKPDVALVLEVTHATDSPGLDARQFGSVKLGHGPTVSIGRENHPEVVNRLRAVARKEKLELQIETFSMLGGTNAKEIWTAQGGIPAAVVAVPDRYMHSTVETVDLHDVENTAKLVAAFCMDLKRGETFKVRIKGQTGK